VRYEHAQPGELVHVGVKMVGRIEGDACERADGDAPLGATLPLSPRRTSAGEKNQAVGSSSWLFG
jgi:hypothetical protein